MLAQEMESPKYMRFNVSAVTFKIVHGHEIQAYVLVPKNISPGKHPLLVKIHGGGFVSCGPLLLSCVTSQVNPIGSLSTNAYDAASTEQSHRYVGQASSPDGSHNISLISLWKTMPS